MDLSTDLYVLVPSNTHTVYGRGQPDPRVMSVDVSGRGPGKDTRNTSEVYLSNKINYGLLIVVLDTT